MNQEMYRKFVTTVAEGALSYYENDLEEADWELVATQSIISFGEDSGEGQPLTYFACGPWQTSAERIKPYDVFLGTDREYSVDEPNSADREFAVDLLARDIEDRAKQLHTEYPFEYTESEYGVTLEYRGATLELEGGGPTKVSVYGDDHRYVERICEELNNIAPFHGEGSDIKSVAMDEGFAVTTDWVELGDSIALGYLLVNLCDYAWSENALFLHVHEDASESGSHIVFTMTY